MKGAEKNGRGGHGVGSGCESSVELLVLSCLKLGRASELFAENDG